MSPSWTPKGKGKNHACRYKIGRKHIRTRMYVLLITALPTCTIDFRNTCKKQQKNGQGSTDSLRRILTGYLHREQHAWSKETREPSMPYTSNNSPTLQLGPAKPFSQRHSGGSPMWIPCPEQSGMHRVSPSTLMGTSGRVQSLPQYPL